MTHPLRVRKIITILLTSGKSQGGQYLIRFSFFQDTVMQDKNQKPYFFNPGMTPEQLEEWLNKQMLFVRNYNRLAKEKLILKYT